MTWIHKSKFYFGNKEFLWSAVTSVLFLFGSLVVNWYAGIYATERASNPVTDIILSNTRVYDVDGLFIYGTIFFWAFMLFLCLRDPKIIPFGVKTLALFVIIRSVFISLTHIGPFPMQAAMDASVIISKFAFGGDLFFSGHTGLPFLMALVFWDRIYLRILFILSAVTFGVIVLLAHLHYSIDVLSAFFITYTIYRIAEMFFQKEQELFKHGLKNS